MFNNGRRRHFLTIVALGVSAMVCLPPAMGADAPPKRVLFIGNSFTQGLFKQLPPLLKSAQPPVDLKVELAAAGGVTLAAHFDPESTANKSAHTLQKLREGHWDLVVLQEYSSRPLETEKRSADKPSGYEEFMKFGKLFDAEIKKQGARTAFYMTWAKKPEPENFAKLAAAYRKLGAELQASVAPVGVALQQAIQEVPHLGYYSDDQKHLKDPGYYLAACVFYGFLTGHSPAGLSYHPAGLAADDAAKLQAIAWEMLQLEKLTPNQP